MNKQRKFVPVMLTPFNGDGSIDYKGLTTLTEFYLESGAAGLFANCLSSEMFELSRAERLKIVQHVIDVVGGAVPVLATGTFSDPLNEQAAFTNELHALGTEAVIVITGIMAGEHESGEIFDERVFNFMELTPGVPLGFYECPVPYKRILSAEQLGRFAATGRVIYHKDTSLDMNSIRAKLAAVHAADFGIYDAYMVHAVESLKAGSAGLSCIQGNYFPEMITWLCHHFDTAGMEAAVQKVQQFFRDNMDVMHDVYPTVSKYCLQQRGIAISAYTRRDVGVFTPDMKLRIDTLLEDYKILQSEIGMH